MPRPNYVLTVLYAPHSLDSGYVSWAGPGRLEINQSIKLPRALTTPSRRRQREKNSVRNHFIIVMIRWTGLAPWEFEFPFPGSLTSIFLAVKTTREQHRAEHRESNTKRVLSLSLSLSLWLFLSLSEGLGSGCRKLGLAALVALNSKTWALNPGP